MFETLLIHSCVVVRRALTGADEDGTPTEEDETVYSGPCRLNTPKDVYPAGQAGNAEIAKKITRRTKLYLLPEAVLDDDDRVVVTTDHGTSTWFVRGTTDVDDFTGTHHHEVNLVQYGNV
jgi:hypothetical protein